MMSSTDFGPVVEGRHDRATQRRRSRRASVMLRRCPTCSGVSRTASTRRRLSLSTTSAARDSSEAVTPERNLAHGADRARRDDHAHGWKRAGRNRRTDIGIRIMDRSERAHVLRLEVGLVGHRHLGRLAHHQMGFDLGFAQHFQNPHAVDRAGGAGNADDQPRACLAMSVLTLSLCHGRRHSSARAQLNRTRREGRPRSPVEMSRP